MPAGLSEQIQEKWKPLFRPDLRKTKELVRFHDSMNRENAPGGRLEEPHIEGS
jgi:hypothetical protein